MSENTPCNYCTLQDMSAEATKRDTSITMQCAPRLVSVEDGGRAEMNMIAVQFDDQDEPSAYFLAVSDRCVC